MTAIKKHAVLFAACLILAGCALDGGVENNSKETTAEKFETQTQSETADEPVVPDKCIATIDIWTNDIGPDVMDFVTAPVTRHVAKKIASWTPYYVLPPEPYYMDCSVSVTDTDNKLLIDSANASVKVRGNWTTAYNKKPLRIKFETKQSMLGLNDGGEYKNWLLLAEYKDFSMLRNKTALQLAGEILGKDGYYASDSQLVEVTINGEYWGVYLLAVYYTPLRAQETRGTVVCRLGL